MLLLTLALAISCFAQAKIVIQKVEQELVLWTPAKSEIKEHLKPAPSQPLTKRQNDNSLILPIEKKLKARYPELITSVDAPPEHSKEIVSDSQQVMSELKKVFQNSNQNLLFLPANHNAVEVAKKAFQGQLTPMSGAWSIAVLGTAVWKGFAQVPCAEFQSELIRQAYRRAGVDINKYFSNSTNPLRAWATSSVIGLRNALSKAGWTLWSHHSFYPGPGAILFHALATSPGHVSMSASESGRVIIDNGKPKGRDLEKTSVRIVQLMYQHHMFMLPPGIRPQPRQQLENLNFAGK